MNTPRFLMTASLAATLTIAACGQNQGQQPVGQPTPGSGGGDVPSSGVPGENVVPTPHGDEGGHTAPPASPATAAPTT